MLVIYTSDMEQTFYSNQTEKGRAVGSCVQKARYAKFLCTEMEHPVLSSLCHPDSSKGANDTSAPI